MFVRAGWDPSRFADYYVRVAGNEQRASAMRQRVAKLPPSTQDLYQPPISDDARFALRKQEAQKLAGRRRTSPSEEARPEVLVNAFPNCLGPEDLPEQKLAQGELLRPAFADEAGSFDKGPIRRPRQ